jgi:hypothetical protein
LNPYYYVLKSQKARLLEEIEGCRTLEAMRRVLFSGFKGFNPKFIKIIEEVLNERNK